jgi:hypothetical protein
VAAVNERTVDVAARAVASYWDTQLHYRYHEPTANASQCWDQVATEVSAAATEARELLAAAAGAFGATGNDDLAARADELCARLKPLTTTPTRLQYARRRRR